MSFFIADTALDAALDVLATATEMVTCSAAPVDYADLANVALGSYAMAAGDFTKGDGTTGRRLTVAAKTGNLATADGTASQTVLADGASILYITETPATVMTLAVEFDVNSWYIEIADATTGV